MNNKGFAISGILYSILVIFLLVLLTILGTLGSRKVVLDKTKMEVFDMLNTGYDSVLDESEITPSLKSKNSNIIVNLNEFKKDSLQPNLIETVANNNTAIIKLDSCFTNYTCICTDQVVSCTLNSNNCEVTITNVNKNTTCDLKYLQN